MRGGSKHIEQFVLWHWTPAWSLTIECERSWQSANTSNLTGLGVIYDF